MADRGYDGKKKMYGKSLVVCNADGRDDHSVRDERSKGVVIIVGFEEVERDVEEERNQRKDILTGETRVKERQWSKGHLRRGQYQRGYLKLRSRSVLAGASPTKEGRNERVQGDEQDILNQAPSNGRPRSRTREQSRTRTWQGIPDPCPQTSPLTQRPEQCLALADPCSTGPARNAEGIHNAVGSLG